MAPSKKRRNKRGVSGSYIIMGIIALAYSGVFPLFGIFHIAKFAFTVWAVGKVFKTIVRKMHAKEDAEAERLEEEERKRKAEERKAKRLEDPSGERTSSRSGDLRSDRYHRKQLQSDLQMRD